MEFDLQTWIRERDEAACSFNLDKFKAFINKYSDIYGAPYMPAIPSDFVLEITMRKMVLAMANPPADKYAEACEWLTAHGCDLEV